MSKLSEELIVITEEAILSDMLVPKDDNTEPSISYQYYDDAEEAWNLIKNSEKNYYIQFASNGAGMTSYGFYKANDGQIYIIEAWINEIRKIYFATNKIHCLSHVIKDD